MVARPAELHRATSSDGAAVGPLSFGQRTRLAAEIIVAFVRARHALHRAPIDTAVAMLRMHARARSETTATTPADIELAEARRLGRAVVRTLTLVPGDTRCLVRSLVLTRLLARRGIPAKLVIGARAAPDFLAHAWVECAGHPVISPGDGSYGRLIEL
ncbi:MAG TPA: lasso peptide biosynthesis B2 protein [Solirubrobacteraceae bacterium]|nr:lasso peptide biosynthesis B2 protein [Solirubrobacteraceae bacterium]